MGLDGLNRCLTIQSHPFSDRPVPPFSSAVIPNDALAGAKDATDAFGLDTSVPDGKEAQPQPAVAQDKQPDPEPPVDGNTDANSALAKPVPEPESRSSGESVPTTDDSAAAVEKDDDQSEAYVGEGTWEERTYRELVRLREEMFWARVGAVAH
ncbi:hypothetical protein BD413DRAFT_616301 [Trametes elegans]|nr:hypothetical protein BD413DRAFT_616301 [Trametes elegans]